MDKANLAEAVNGHIDNKVITPKVLRQWGDKVGAVSVVGKASKNLFNVYKYGKNNTYTSNVSKYNIINNNEIEISYINGWSRLVLKVTGLEPNTDYTISAYLDKSNYDTSVASGFYDGSEYKDSGFTKGSGNVYLTFTSSSTGTFDMWFYGNWSGTNYSGSIVYQNIQLEKGSATEYEKYYEPIISIKDSNGDYHEVPYVTGKVSKNLFDKATMVEFTNGYRLYTNGTFNNNSSFYGLKIPVQPNTTYTSSSNLTDTNLWSDLCFFDKSMNFISGVEGRANKTFTTPANCYFVTYAIYNQYQWFQLEKGLTKTEYEEYFEPSISIRDNNGNFHEIINKVETAPAIAMADGYTLSGAAFGKQPILEKQGKIVHLAMLVVAENGFVDTLTGIARLPEGFRPKYTQVFPCGLANAHLWYMDKVGYLNIGADGYINIRNSTGDQKYAFINITFMTD